MKRVLVLRSLAEVDLAEIAAWYERRHARLASRFLDAFDVAAAELLGEPMIHALIEAPVRRVLMKSFPYHIYYVVDADRVIVLGIYHAARHPDTWRERL